MGVCLVFLASSAQAEDQDNDDSRYILRFFGVDIGLVEPVGSAEAFYLPNTIALANGAPEPFSDYFSAGITTNFYAGVMTTEGFEASISFKITKVNFTNFSEGIIQSGTSESSGGGSFSSYLLGSQIYLGQRLKPLKSGKGSLYFGVAGDFSTLKHYSQQFTAAEDQTLSISFIAGQEIQLIKDRNSERVFTFRVQTEFVALASSSRPRYVGLTFGIRQYFH